MEGDGIYKETVPDILSFQWSHESLDMCVRPFKTSQLAKMSTDYNAWMSPAILHYGKKKKNKPDDSVQTANPQNHE